MKKCLKSWYFGNTSRREAERLLEYLDNDPGVFLIRESETKKDGTKCWSLSILDFNKEKQRHTKHYLINSVFNLNKQKMEYYLSERFRFNSLDSLIDHYSSNLVKKSNSLVEVIFEFCFFFKLRKSKWALSHIDETLC